MRKLQRVTRKVMSRNRDYSKGVARAKAKSIISRRSVGSPPTRSAASTARRVQRGRVENYEHADSLSRGRGRNKVYRGRGQGKALGKMNQPTYRATRRGQGRLSRGNVGNLPSWRMKGDT